MRFAERKIDGLLRGMVLAVILVGAASVRRLSSGHAAVRPAGAEVVLASSDGRFTLEADCSLFDAAPARAGDLTIDSEVEAVEVALLTGEGFELSAAIDEGGAAMTVVEDCLIPLHYGGVFECEGDLVLAPESSVWIGIGADIEAIRATGQIQLGGLLIVECSPMFHPAAGDEYVIVAGDSINGTFDAIEWRGWPEGSSPRFEVRANEVVVVVD